MRIERTGRQDRHGKPHGQLCIQGVTIQRGRLYRFGLATLPEGRSFQSAYDDHPDVLLNRRHQVLHDCVICIRHRSSNRSVLRSHTVYQRLVGASGLGIVAVAVERDPPANTGYDSPHADFFHLSL